MIMNNVNIKLSEHFSLAELTKTNVNLKNVPNEVQVENLKRLCKWLEFLRDEWNLRYEGAHSQPLPRGEGLEMPIVINSGFRSEAVNKAVGGSATSNHLTGCAADIRVSGIEQLVRYATILLDISDESLEDFDELLLERNAKGAYWLHFAVRAKGNRRKVRLIGLSPALSVGEGEMRNEE